MNDPLLEVEDLHAWYGESHVLHGVSLDLRPGETVALLGRNGAGKTTTLRSILGIVRKRQGAIRLKGRDIFGLPLHKIARLGIGYVPEERGIFATLNVSENLLLPPVLASGGPDLEEIHALFPNIASRSRDPGTKLSGGEQQMLAIARTLHSGVKILLLDEPTEGLAPVIIQRIAALLHDLKTRGLSVLLVEQNFHFARGLADRFYVMENGLIVDAFHAAELPDRMERLEDLIGL